MQVSRLNVARVQTRAPAMARVAPANKRVVLARAEGGGACALRHAARARWTAMSASDTRRGGRIAAAACGGAAGGQLWGRTTLRVLLGEPQPSLPCSRPACRTMRAAGAQPLCRATGAPAPAAAEAGVRRRRRPPTLAAAALNCPTRAPRPPAARRRARPSAAYRRRAAPRGRAAARGAEGGREWGPPGISLL